MDPQYRKLESIESPLKKGIHQSVFIQAPSLGQSAEEDIEIVLSNEWFEQLDYSNNGKQLVRQMFVYIAQRPSSTLTVKIHFDKMGVTNEEEYAKGPASQKLYDILKTFKKLNGSDDLQTIRVKEANTRGTGKALNLIKLKEFTFSAIGWQLFQLEKYLRVIQENVLTDRISINISNSLLSQKSAEQLVAIVRNSPGLYKEIDLNLSNCSNVNLDIFHMFIDTNMMHQPQVFRLSFRGWGAKAKDFFNNQFDVSGLCQNAQKRIMQLRKKLYVGKMDVTLDFRTWDQQFKLKEIEQLNNSEKENQQSFGMFSKTIGRSKPVYNVVFLS